jgi:hypothetical protein
MLWIGIADAVFCIGIAVMMNIYPECDATVWSMVGWTVGLQALAAAGLYLAASYFLGWYVIDDETLDYPLIGPGRGKLKWTEIERASANHYLHMLVLRTRDGRKAYISAGLEGELSIYDIVMHYVPRKAVDPALLNLMESFAREADT